MTTSATTAMASSTEQEAVFTPETSWWRRDGNGILCVMALLYAALYLLFWPVLYTTMDEAAYMNLAYAMTQGTMYLDVAGVSPVQDFLVDGHRISLYPPGMGTLLALPGFISWNLALGFNLFVHLALFALVIKLLRANKTPALFALLYLLHPVAVLFSRTVMSDLPAALALTLAFWATTRKRYFLCGVLIGASVIIRTISAVSAVFLIAGILLEGTRFFKADDAPLAAPLAERIRRGVLVALGVLPFVIGAWLYQKVVQDGGWERYAQPGMISVRHLPVQLPFYTIALLVLYPGMLIAPLFYRGIGRAPLLLFTGGFFAFYCCYYFHDEGSTKAETFLVGQRFLLVIMPLMIVAYSRLIWRFVAARPHFSPLLQKAVVAGVCVALFVAAGMIHRRHGAYLANMARVRAAVLQIAPQGSLLLCNVHLAKMLHPGWASRSIDLLSATGNQEVDVQRTEESVRTKMAQMKRERKPGAEVTVALWSRAYRPETPRELYVLQKLEAAFETRSLPADVKASLPSDLYILQIVGERTSNSSPIKQTPSMSRPTRSTAPLQQAN